MNPFVYSITGPTGSADTTVNDQTNFNSYLIVGALIPNAAPAWVVQAMAEEQFLAGVKPAGANAKFIFECLQANPRTGMSLLTAMFNPVGQTEKTCIYKDKDDTDRQWQFNFRALGVGVLGPSVAACYVAMVSNFPITSSSNTESSWDTTSSPTKAITISVGNTECYPVLNISAAAATGGGHRYCAFVKLRNNTRLNAVQYPIDITGGGWNTSALVNFTAISLQVNQVGGVDAVVTTIPYDTVTGSLPTVPFWLYRNGEQLLVSARTGTTSGNLTVARGKNGSVASVHADNAVLALSKIAFDGRDVRIKIGDGSGQLADVPYWFGVNANAFNTTVTKIWINYNFLARAIGTLSASISNVDTSLTIGGAEGPIDTTSGVLIFSAGAGLEATPYSTYNPSTGVVDGMTRAGRSGSANSHTAGETVYFIRDAWIYYGGTSAATPTYNTDAAYLSLKPVFNLDSTNALWTFDNVAAYQTTYTGNQPFEFKANPGATSLKGICYTADASGSAPFVNPAPADPATFIGLAAQKKNAAPFWQLNIPFGFGNGSASASLATTKKLNLPASRACLEASDGTRSYVSATSGAAWQTFETLTITPTYASYWLKFVLNNNTTADWTKVAAVQAVSAAVNLLAYTSDPSFGYPSVTLGSEQAVEIDLDATFTNQTTNEAIRIIFPNLAVGQTLKVDTLSKAIVYLKDNSYCYFALQPYPARRTWLRLLKGSNTLACSQTGLTVSITEQYRNSSTA